METINHLKTDNLNESTKLLNSYQNINKSDNLLETNLEIDENYEEKIENKMPYLQSLIDGLGLKCYHYLIILTACFIFYNEGSLIYELNFIYPKLDKVLNLTYSRKTALTISLLIGKFIGALSSNIFNYYMDRKWAIIIFSFSTSLFSFLFILFENLGWMISCRFTIGFSIAITNCIILPILIEICPTYKREWVILAIVIFYRLGIIIYVILFHLILQPRMDDSNFHSTWRYSIIISSYMTAIVFIFSFFSASDSPRSLMNKGEFSKAVLILEKITDSSKVQINRELLKLEMEVYSKENRIQSNWKDIFLGKYLKVTILTSLIMFTILFNNLGNLYILPLIVPPDNSNLWLTVLIQQLLAIIGYIIFTFFAATGILGRQYSMTICFSIIFILSFMTFITGKWISYTFPIINIFISGSAIMCKLYTNEIFPTKIRQAGYSFAVMIGLLGFIILPTLADYLKTFSEYLPVILVVISSIIGIIASLLLPFETAQIQVDSY